MYCGKYFRYILWIAWVLWFKSSSIRSIVCINEYFGQRRFIAIELNKSKYSLWLGCQWSNKPIWFQNANLSDGFGIKVTVYHTENSFDLIYRTKTIHLNVQWLDKFWSFIMTRHKQAILMFIIECRFCWNSIFHVIKNIIAFDSGNCNESKMNKIEVVLHSFNVSFDRTLWSAFSHLFSLIEFRKFGYHLKLYFQKFEINKENLRSTDFWLGISKTKVNMLRIFLMIFIRWVNYMFSY